MADSSLREPVEQRHGARAQTRLGRTVELARPWRGKGLVDRLAAAAALALTSPLFLLVAAAVQLTSPGPVFYRDRRLGAGGREYLMLKFRTMRSGAPPLRTAAGKLVVGADDPRLTPVGRPLRRYRLDELPQFVNVLRGQMSIVGPRPDQPQDEATYDDIAYERLRVAPGITGLATVLDSRHLTNETMFALDAAYVRRQGPVLDLLVAALTPIYLICGPTLPARLLKGYSAGIRLERLDDAAHEV